MQEEKALAGNRQVCSFHLDDLLFGIEALEVQEVIRSHAMTEVPLAPAEVVGLMNLRGHLVTAIDLRRRMNMPEREADALPHNIVVDAPGGLVSFMVDRVGSVFELSEEEYEASPEVLGDGVRPYVKGVYSHDGGLLMLLDVAEAVKTDTMRL